MIVYPAIDIKDGKCTRLYQGKFNQATRYSESPESMAQSFKTAGASWVHVIDLEGAYHGQTQQTALILNLKKYQLNIQTGGGIRKKSDIQIQLDQGIQRIIVGTIAIQNPNTFKNWLNHFGAEKIVLAVDFRWQDHQPYIAQQGWQNTSNCLLWDLLDSFQNIPLKHILCTDITRDGTLKGPNLQIYQQLKNRYPKLEIQASGGISSLKDLDALFKTGVSGAVIGKALYEKRFSLSQAIKLFSNPLQEVPAC